MIVVGLNQTLDRTIRLASLTPGTVMRTDDVVLTGGGKAVNAARAALTLGHPCRLVGPLPGALGRYATGLLRAEGLDIVPVDAVDGEIRGTTITIEADGRATVINEAGPAMRPDAWNRIIAGIAQLLADAERPQHRAPWLVVSGSAPPNTPSNADADLVELAHHHRWRIAIDATGERLAAASAAGADLVSPNLAEATAMLAGHDVDELVDSAIGDVIAATLEAASALVKLGALQALVSAGRHGVAVADGRGATFQEAPVVEVTNPIGAGDSLLGATVVALERGLGFGEAVRHGVAYAAASVQHPVAGYADLSDYRRNREHVDSALGASGGRP